MEVYDTNFHFQASAEKKQQLEMGGSQQGYYTFDGAQCTARPAHDEQDCPQKPEATKTKGNERTKAPDEVLHML